MHDWFQWAFLGLLTAWTVWLAVRVGETEELLTPIRYRRRRR